MIMKPKLKLMLLAMTALSSNAIAQEAPKTVNNQENKSDTDIVIVTAQKRSQNAQTVPISMTVLGGAKLADKGISTITDVQFAAPSLSISDAGLTKSVNIRGIGLASGSPNASNGVATYVDGVFQPPIVAGGTYYDIANIEVLRGPQGTLVGSNSTGGALFINTQSPKLSLVEGNVELGVGDYGASGGQASINLPLGDKLAFRIAVNAQKHDSYYTDHGDYNNHPGRLDEKDARVGVLWRPSDSYQAIFKIDSILRETGGYAYQPVPGTTYGSLIPSDSSAYDIYYNALTANNERALQSTLEQKITLPGNITLKSITGYQDKKIHNLYDFDGTETATDTQNQYVGETVATQEFDLLSPTDGAFSWVTGLYFQRNRINVDISRGAFPTDIIIANKKTTYGVFGQTNYKITPTLNATLGIRYSGYEIYSVGDVKIGAGITGFPTDGLVVADLGGHEKDNAVTGKFGLEWSFAPRNMIYGFAARGYKNGGINSPTQNFEKEVVWNYEAGWKTSLLDNKVKAQFDVFYSDYKNFQFDTVNTASGQATIQNVPSATIAGFEAEMQGRFGNLKLDGSLAYVKSELGDYEVIDQNLLPAGALFPQCAVGQTVGCTDYTDATVDVTGAPNLFSPEFTFNIGAEYQFDLANGSTITPRINYSYQSSQEAVPSLNKAYQIEARGLVSAVINFARDDWNVQLRVNNLTNEKYVTGYVINGSSGNRFYGAPRTVMLVVGKHF